LLLATLILLLIASKVIAQSIKPKQKQTDPEVPWREITYKPESVGNMPVGTYPPPVIEKPKVAVSTRTTSGNNEQLVWAYLIQRYTRNQTAGIMGNLQQEHNFQTSGDGLAQWNGGRKARLLAMPNPYSLETQLSFLDIELRESGLVLPDDVVGATVVFQNQFERCGVCNEPARINYAYAILGRY
jgi:hypothetical protein